MSNCRVGRERPLSHYKVYGGPTGLPATCNCESRQARKGATAAMDTGAGVKAGMGYRLIYSILISAQSQLTPLF